MLELGIRRHFKGMTPMSSGYDLAARVRPDGGCSIRNLKRYIRDGKLAADLEVPFEDNSSFKYFKEETVKKYAKQYGGDLITPANMKNKFMDMVKTMDMSYSYKPVLLKVIL